MISLKLHWSVTASLLACFLLTIFVTAAAADDKKNKSSGMSGNKSSTATSGSKSSSGMSGSKKSSSDKPKVNSSGQHQGTTSSSSGTSRSATPPGHEHSGTPGTSDSNPPSGTPRVIIRSGSPGYVPGSTTVVPVPSGSTNVVPSGPTVIQRNFPPTAPVANTIPGQPVSVAPNEIPAAAAPANEVPGGFEPLPADQVNKLCERLRTVMGQTMDQLKADPISKDKDVGIAGDNLVKAIPTRENVTSETPAAIAKAFEDMKKVVDAKVMAGTISATEGSEFNYKLDTLNNTIQAMLIACTPPAPGSGTPPAAPGSGTPPAAPGTGTPPPTGNPPAPVPMPPNPADPVTIYINIYDPIIIIEDPLIDDGVILAIDPGTVVIGTGGEGELTVTSGTPEDIGIPVRESEPIPEADAGFTGACGVILNNPKTSRGKVNYTLDGKPFSMEPGYTHELPGDRTYLVEFDKGGTFGKARYTLAEGTYDFGVAAQGWDIFSKTYEAVLDNTGNSNDFHYVCDDQRLVVKAREQATLTGKCPILIIFDQGNGGEPARRVLREGTYTVGVDPSTRLLDLFRDDAPAKVRTDGPTPAPASVQVPAPVPMKPKP